MFKVDDKVWIKSKELQATVIYYEDGYIEVELQNGTEVAFENTKDLEAFTGQVASPKSREPTWSEIFQANLERDR